MTISALQQGYASGRKPIEIIEEIYRRIEKEPLQPVWISLVPRETALARARALERRSPKTSSLPLYGIPFAISDNIDVEGVPTTAGCPDYSYTASQSATTVWRLIQAGAIPIGKTNLDQFASGLTGVRSPYGACSSVFGDEYISGGSSSGAAIAVAKGLVAFALGSDAGGAGRVPAAFNDLVGLKPTRGVLSTSGVVPACRTLDCVSIFSRTCGDAHAVWKAAKGFDPDDPFSREPRCGGTAAPWLAGAFRFGVPFEEQLEFFGDSGAAELYEAAVARLQELGGEKVEIDFSIFRLAADLLARGPWDAERLSAIREFLPAHGESMQPVVYETIMNGAQYSAVDSFHARYRLKELRRASEAQWSRMDVMVVPTTGTIYTHADVADDPIGTDHDLGIYTRFVNLLDLAAVAVPAGFRSNGIPFGVSVIGPQFSDEALLVLADRFHRSQVMLPGEPLQTGLVPPGCIALAVVGAHLTDQPMHWQIIEARARLLKATRTAPGYRLFALEGTKPTKAGLVRDEQFQGAGIEVEVYAMPEDHFGAFAVNVPAPLTIGNLVLESGDTVKGFLAEPSAIQGAVEITEYGGWRNYLARAEALA
jgi:allophanate hydrolase